MRRLLRTLANLTLSALVSGSALLVACGSSEICRTADGEFIPVGERSHRNPCLFCPEPNGELVGLFEDGCVQIVEEEPIGVPQITELASGPDADGDGLDDLLIADTWGFSDELGAGRVWLRQSSTGEVIDIAEGEERGERLGGRMLLVPDLSGDGLADVILGAFGSLADKDREGMPRPDPGTLIVKTGLGEELYRLEGDTDCRAFGHRVAGGPDVDGDGLSDILVSDPGCYLWEDSESPFPVSALDGRVALLSGATGRELRTWTAPTDFHDYASAFVGFVDDQDGDGVADVAISSGAALNPDRTIEIFSSVTGDVLESAISSAWGRVHEIADLDRDGQLDLLSVRHGETKLIVSIFSASPREAVLGPGALRISSVPFADGVRVAIMDMEPLRIVDGGGVASFVGTSTREDFAAVHDANGDGTFDIVVGTVLSGGRGARLKWHYSGNMLP